MKKYLFAFLVIALLVLIGTSCSEEDSPVVPPYEWNTELPIPPYNAIITNGCDPYNDIIYKKPFSYPAEFPEQGEDNFVGIWANIGEFILKGTATSILNTLNKPLMNKLSTFFFGEDENTKRFNQIMNQLNEINHKMDLLLEKAEKTLRKIDELQYNQMHDGYVDFNNNLAVLTSLNDEFYNKLKEDMTEEELCEIMNKWGDRVVNGNSAPYAMKALAQKLSDFSYLYDGQDRNLFAVYDMIVFHNTPWETMGYDLRDMFRAALAFEFARTAYMTTLYFTVNKSEVSINNVQKTTEWLIKYFSTQGNAVTRRTDKVVCQLEGAHFIADADALHEHTSWTGSCWMNSEQTAFAQGNLSSSPDVSKMKQSQLTQSEVSAITTYYKGVGKGKKYTLLHCLAEGGMKVKEDYYKPVTWFTTDSIIVDTFSPIYFMHQGTNAETYMTQYNDIMITLQSYYCVGLPIGSITLQFKSSDQPVYSTAIKKYKGSSADVGGDTYEKEVFVHNMLFFTKWRLLGNDQTFKFPGMYFLGLKEGSLNRY